VSGIGFVQQIVAQPAIETLDEGVLYRLARGNVVPGDLLPIRPGRDCGRGQLGAIVRDDAAGAAAHGDDLVELAGRNPYSRRLRAALLLYPHSHDIRKARD
jgi:hypothetical protein